MIYHGNGGFNFSDVYNMPIWARKFYVTKIIEFKKEERNIQEKEIAKAKSKARR